ncbi:hypothetical protein [Falsirhodobacter sp. 1013]|uniref:hypothetical protein n=1 Tax=Falsirhodobacter sp. 1013 TaxID=3417566 RepID=UPI003EBEE768
MTDLAALGFSIDSSQAVKAAGDLDKLTASAGRSEKGVLDAVRKATDAINSLSSGLAGYSSTIAQALEQTQRPAQQAARSFNDIRASLDPLFAATQRYANVQKELTAAVARGEASQDQANAVLQQARNRYLDVTTAAQTQRQAIEQLRASLDPAYAAAQRMTAAEVLLTAALKAGTIGAREHKLMMDQVRAAYAAPVEAVQAVGAAQVAATSTSREFAVAQATVGKEASKLGPQIQNASYQIGDFAVQVASGQSAAMAFAQQFPQLAGGLGVWGAAIGAAVAIGAGLYKFLSTAKEETKTLDEALQSVTATTDAYKNAVDRAALSSADLTTEFGTNASAARETLQVLSGLAQLKALDALDASVKSVTEGFKDARSEIGEALKFIAQGNNNIGASAIEAKLRTAELKNEYSLTADQASRVSVAYDAMVKASGASEIKQNTSEFLDILIEVYGTVDAIPKSMRDVATAAGTANVEAARLEQLSLLAADGLGTAAAEARGLASALQAATGFSAGLDTQIAVVEAKISALRTGQNAANAGQIEGLRQEAQAQRDATVAAGEAAIVADNRLAIDLAAIDVLSERMNTEDQLTASIRAQSKATKAGTSEAEKYDKQMQSMADGWLKRIQTPAEKYAEQLSEITSLQAAGKLTAEQFARAQNLINEEVREGNPLMEQLSNSFWDFLERGAADFASFKDAMIGGFRTMLVSMIRMAAQNKLMIGVGMGGAGGVAGAASAATGVGGGMGGGLMQGAGFLGQITGFGSSVLSGITAPLQAALSSATSGGIMQGFQSYSASLSANAAGFNGLGMQIGAYLGPAIAGTAIGGMLAGDYKIAGLGGSTTSMIGAGIGALIGGPLGGLVGGALGGLTNRLFGKRLAGAGIEGKFYGTGGFSGSTYQSYKGGVFGSDSTERQALDKATQDTLSQSFGALRESVVGMADTLGIAGDTFDNFIYKFRFSTDDKSPEEIAEKFQAKLEDAGHAMADMIAGIDKYAKSGEEALDTLTRLSQSLVGVTSIMDTLSHTFSATGLAGADMASALAELFGGLDAMGTATQTYYNAFYTEEQRRSTLERQMTEQLAKLNIAMPKTRDAYMAMIEAQDLTTEKGRETYAALIQLAAGMDSVLPAVASFTAEIAALAGTVSTELATAISGAEAAAQTYEQSARLWYQTAQSLRDFIHDLNNSNLSYINPQQALTGNQTRFDTLLERVKGGDVDAAKSITGAASDLLTSLRQTSRSQAEYATAAARVTAGLSLAAGISDLEGANDDVLRSLYEQQIDVLTQLQNFLSYQGLTEEAIKQLPKDLQAMVRDFDGTLAQFDQTTGAIEAAIKDVTSFSYAALQERLKVNVDLIAKADVPDYIRGMLTAANEGIRSSIDFIVRKDLPADLKWIAITGQSTMIKEVQALMSGKSSASAVELALKTMSNRQVTVTAILASGMSDSQKRLLHILGDAQGMLTLGGSFKFDPAASFTVWYETATKAAITNPMDNLRTAIQNLYTVVKAEADLQARIAGVNQSAATLTSNKEGTLFATTKQINALAAQAGIPTKGKTLTEIGAAIAALSGSDSIDRVQPIANLNDLLWLEFTRHHEDLDVDPTDYLGAYADVKRSGVNPQDHFDAGGWQEILAGVRKFQPEVFDWSSIGLNVPAYASGGVFGGGLRLVGERGPELEATGPARIFSSGQTRDMLGNGEVVRELKASREENRQLLMALNASNAKVAKILQKFDKIGLPPEQAATGTAA